MKPVRELLGDKRTAAVLVAVAVLIVGYRLIGAGRGVAPAIPPAAVPEPARTPAPPEPAPPPVEPIRQGWTGPAWSWTRNPFLAPAAERPPAGRTAGNGASDASTGPRPEGLAPELAGTIVGGAVSMAIFRGQGPDGGNRLVPIGGTVGEWILSRVEPYRVSLRRGKETRVLELYRQ